MSSYDIYSFEFSRQKRKVPSFEYYEGCKEKPYFVSLYSYLTEKRELNNKQINLFLHVILEEKGDGFTIYEMMNDEIWDIWEKWYKSFGTLSLYYDQVKKSFTFIENFCINNNVTFEDYKKKHAAKHIREEKVESTVAVYLNLVDKKKITSVEKLLLKKFIKQYNLIKYRLYDEDLKLLLEDQSSKMKKVLESVSDSRKVESKQST